MSYMQPTKICGGFEMRGLLSSPVKSMASAHIKNSCFLVLLPSQRACAFCIYGVHTGQLLLDTTSCAFHWKRLGAT